MLEFQCPVCKKTELLNKTPDAGFALLAYDGCIEWLDPAESVPSLEEYIWRRADQMPAAGETWAVHVQFPFSSEIGETFYTLFRPALSALNGWEEYPEEIDRSAIVRCRLECVLTADVQQAWVRVKVLESVPLGDLLKTYSLQESPEPLGIFSVEEKYRSSYRYGRWTVYEWNAQGDIGGWQLIDTDAAGVQHLVLCGKWDFHSDEVHCGNLVFSKK